jgi:uncharacterized protein
VSSIFKKKIGTEKQIDDFLDKVSESGLIFKSAVDAYLKENIESFEQKLESIAETEHEGDGVMFSLFLKTWIPCWTASREHFGVLI